MSFIKHSLDALTTGESWKKSINKFSFNPCLTTNRVTKPEPVKLLLMVDFNYIIIRHDIAHKVPHNRLLFSPKLHKFRRKEDRAEWNASIWFNFYGIVITENLLCHKRFIVMEVYGAFTDLCSFYVFAQYHFSISCYASWRSRLSIHSHQASHLTVKTVWHHKIIS